MCPSSSPESREAETWTIYECARCGMVVLATPRHSRCSPSKYHDSCDWQIIKTCRVSVARDIADALREAAEGRHRWLHDAVSLDECRDEQCIRARRALARFEKGALKG